MKRGSFRDIVMRVQRWLRGSTESDLDQLRRLTPIAACKGTPRLLFATADIGVAPQVYEEGAFDEAELAWVLRHLDQPQRRGTVVEIGGNIGSTTLSPAYPARRDARCDF